MNELLQAAKTVIDQYDYTGTVEECEAVNRLHEAVDRAEKQEAVGFEEWWKHVDDDQISRPCDMARHAWTAAQLTERERIRARVQIAAEQVWKAGDWYIGPQHNMIEKFIDALLEDSDAS